MEKVAKSVWQYAIKNGFSPKNQVKKTSHGRFYYPVLSDYRALQMFLTNLEKSKKG